MSLPLAYVRLRLDICLLISERLLLLQSFVGRLALRLTARNIQLRLLLVRYLIILLQHSHLRGLSLKQAVAGCWALSHIVIRQCSRLLILILDVDVLSSKLKPNWSLAQRAWSISGGIWRGTARVRNMLQVQILDLLPLLGSHLRVVQLHQARQTLDYEGSVLRMIRARIMREPKHA